MYADQFNVLIDRLERHTKAVSQIAAAHVFASAYAAAFSRRDSASFAERTARCALVEFVDAITTIKVQEDTGQ